MRRPAEQLYDTAADPYELNNLAADAAHAETKARLDERLDKWMQSQGDPGIDQDTQKALEAARRGKHLFGPSR